MLVSACSSKNFSHFNELASPLFFPHIKIPPLFKSSEKSIQSERVWKPSGRDKIRADRNAPVPVADIFVVITFNLSL